MSKDNYDLYLFVLITGFILFYELLVVLALIRFFARVTSHLLNKPNTHQIAKRGEQSEYVQAQNQQVIGTEVANTNYDKVIITDQQFPREKEVNPNNEGEPHHSQQIEIDVYPAYRVSHSFRSIKEENEDVSPYRFTFDLDKQNEKQQQQLQHN